MTGERQDAASNAPAPAPDVAPPAGPVERSALVDWLLASDEPVVAIGAPPGYGKSTLLSQWRERRGSRVASVSCDRIHDDPRSLWSELVATLGSAEPPGPAAAGFIEDVADALAESLTDMLGALRSPRPRSAWSRCCPPV